MRRRGMGERSTAPETAAPPGTGRQNRVNDPGRHGPCGRKASPRRREILSVAKSKVSIPRSAHPLLADLPEETLRRLEIYAYLLEKWQRAVNLVGNSTL